MHRFQQLSLATLVLLLLSACAGHVKEPGNDRPVWIDNPGNGVSASAGMHVRGPVAQEELAILRARRICKAFRGEYQIRADPFHHGGEWPLKYRGCRGGA